MHRQLYHLTLLSLLALLLAAPGLALAHGAGPQQTIDGYLVTLVTPAKGWRTGSNPVEVILWDARGRAVDATVTIAPLTYAPPNDGHGATHSDDEPAHGDTPAAHADDHADDGQGLASAAVPLVAGEEMDVYAGELAFAEAGTYSVSVVFSVDSQEHGAIFAVAVAQSRPRGLVLGGFAFINALAIGCAGVLKWRKPAKPARQASPTPNIPEE
jgi:hypothetical protein